MTPKLPPKAHGPRVTAKRLRDALDRTGTSKYALARISGTAPAQIRRITNGQLRPGPDVAVRLAHALGCSPGWLMGVEEGDGSPRGQERLTAQERAWARWMSDLPDDVREIVQDVGERLARGARKKKRRR